MSRQKEGLILQYMLEAITAQYISGALQYLIIYKYFTLHSQIYYHDVCIVTDTLYKYYCAVTQFTCISRMITDHTA